jgi:hypothetical protein
MRTQPHALALTAAAIVMLVAGGGVARAQEVVLKGGVSSATLSFERESGSAGAERRNGWLAGAAMLLLPADRGGWQLDLLLVQKGAKNILRRDDEVRLLYLEIPLLLHLDYWQRGDRAAYVTVGPSVAFNLQASYMDDGQIEDIGDDIQGRDFGLNLGTGVEFGPLVVEARYTWGVRKVFAVDDVDFKNHSLALTAGIRFR